MKINPIPHLCMALALGLLPARLGAAQERSTQAAEQSSVDASAEAQVDRLAESEKLKRRGAAYLVTGGSVGLTAIVGLTVGLLRARDYDTQFEEDRNAQTIHRAFVSGISGLAFVGIALPFIVCGANRRVEARQKTRSVSQLSTNFSVGNSGGTLSLKGRF